MKDTKIIAGITNHETMDPIATHEDPPTGHTNIYVCFGEDRSATISDEMLQAFLAEVKEIVIAQDGEEKHYKFK